VESTSIWSSDKSVDGLRTVNVIPFQSKGNPPPLTGSLSSNLFLYLDSSAGVVGVLRCLPSIEGKNRNRLLSGDIFGLSTSMGVISIVIEG
jgi:hypothetical protein